MSRRKGKACLRGSLIILAACLAGGAVAQGAGNQNRPGDESDVGLKQALPRRQAESKDRQSNSAKTAHSDQTSPGGSVNIQASGDTTKEIAQLKRQLALQQKQIDQLLRTMNQLEALIAAGQKPAKGASAAQPSDNARASSNTRSSTDNEIASLVPVLPPIANSTTADTADTRLGSEQLIGYGEAAQGKNQRVSSPSALSAASSLPPAESAAASPLAGGSPVISAPASGQGENRGEIPESPLQFRIGSAYVTPVGFLDFTTVWSNHDAGTGIGTNFGSIPYGNVFQNNLSEFRFSMQNSRVGFRVDAKVKGAHVIGYMESDFLGLSPGNAAVSSNSNSLRSRLYWLDVRKGKWEVLGGQTWSLITPGRTGISPLPGEIFYTQDMDVNYQAGLVWGRIPELRFVYHPSEKAAFAVALESPEQYVGGSAGGGLITFPTALKSTYEGELNIGGNTYSVPNVAPDVIAKLALDPSSKLHFEVGGVERNFKVWNPASRNTYSATGGGAFANLNFELFNGFRLVTNNYWSDGGGRYIFGQVPDLIVQADGSPSLIHAGSTVSGFEYTHQKSMIFAYYGGIYAQRNVAIDANGEPVGYGYSGAPAGQNRTIQEATFGFNQTLWKNARYGKLNLIGQYSYFTRNPWYVITGQSRNANLNRVFFDLRYSLPGSAPAIK